MWAMHLNVAKWSVLRWMKKSENNELLLPLNWIKTFIFSEEKSILSDMLKWFERVFSPNFWNLQILLIIKPFIFSNELSSFLATRYTFGVKSLEYIFKKKHQNRIASINVNPLVTNLNDMVASIRRWIFENLSFKERSVLKENDGTCTSYQFIKIIFSISFCFKNSSKINFVRIAQIIWFFSSKNWTNDI